MSQKIIFMPHANIQYSQLDPARRAWVCEHCYRPLFELVRDGEYRIAFEASGRTLEVMAGETPEVLALLKELIADGRIEPVGSPFIHVMLANIPPEVALHSLKRGLDAWEAYTGVRPETGWNPECGWAGSLPELYKEAGFNNLVMDADSFFLSFPEIREATGLAYDVHSRKHKETTLCRMHYLSIPAIFSMSVYLHDFSEYPTQEINTATSAGRMMLNILITFAQYEREVITERVRDKMAASRKKGKWVGGSVPMGYRVENKKLVVEPEEARVIQRIFQRFIEVQSPALIAQELNKDGIRTKQGKVWDKPHIYRILNNHTYIGQVKYKGSICEGEQNAIVELDVWDRTREILRVNDPAPAHMPRTEIIAPLKGILRCGHCDCTMKPTYTRKNGKRYFYYLCSRDSKRATSTCPVHQIPAGEVERITREQVVKMLQTPTILIKLAQVLNLSAEKIAELFKETFWQEISPGEMNRLLHLILEKIEVHEDKLTVEFKSSGIKTLMEEIANGEETD